MIQNKILGYAVVCGTMCSFVPEIVLSIKDRLGYSGTCLKYSSTSRLSVGGAIESSGDSFAVKPSLIPFQLTTKLEGSNFKGSQDVAKFTPFSLTPIKFTLPSSSDFITNEPKRVAPINRHLVLCNQELGSQDEVSVAIKSGSISELLSIDSLSNRPLSIETTFDIPNLHIPNEERYSFEREYSSEQITDDLRHESINLVASTQSENISQIHTAIIEPLVDVQQDILSYPINLRPEEIFDLHAVSQNNIQLSEENEAEFINEEEVERFDLRPLQADDALVALDREIINIEASHEIQDEHITLINIPPIEDTEIQENIDEQTNVDIEDRIEEEGVDLTQPPPVNAHLIQEVRVEHFYVEAPEYLVAEVTEIAQSNHIEQVTSLTSQTEVSAVLAQAEEFTTYDEQHEDGHEVATISQEEVPSSTDTILNVSEQVTHLVEETDVLSPVIPVYEEIQVERSNQIEVEPIAYEVIQETLPSQALYAVTRAPILPEVRVIFTNEPAVASAFEVVEIRLPQGRVEEHLVEPISPLSRGIKGLKELMEQSAQARKLSGAKDVFLETTSDLLELSEQDLLNGWLFEELVRVEPVCKKPAPDYAEAERIVSEHGKNQAERTQNLEQTSKLLDADLRQLDDIEASIDIMAEKIMKMMGLSPKVKKPMMTDIRQVEERDLRGLRRHLTKVSEVSPLTKRRQDQIEVEDKENTPIPIFRDIPIRTSTQTEYSPGYEWTDSPVHAQYSPMAASIHQKPVSPLSKPKINSINRKMKSKASGKQKSPVLNVLDEQALKEATNQILRRRQAFSPKTPQTFSPDDENSPFAGSCAQEYRMREDVLSSTPIRRRLDFNNVYE